MRLLRRMVTLTPNPRTVSSLVLATLLLCGCGATDLVRPTQNKMTLDRHVTLAYAIAYSPEGDLLATGGIDRVVRLWDLKTGEERQAFDGHRGTVHCLAFTPDGKTLASGSLDKMVRLWDVKTGRERAVLKDHGESVAALAFAPDGKTLASASYDKTIRLWDVATGQRRAILDRHKDRVQAVAYSPDGQTLASGGDDKVVCLWDAATGELRHSLTHEGPISAVAFSPDSLLLAVGLENQRHAVKFGEIRFWDPKAGSERGTIAQGHTFMVTSLGFLPGGEQLAAASKDWTVKLWNASSLANEGTIQHANPVWSLALSPDGKAIATTSGDDNRKLGEIKQWDRATLTPRQ